jgi:hypothetical protein
METDRVERLWQAVMNVAVAMKKDGIDTGDVIKKLREAKVLLNHCIYDEHAHGEELFETEMEIEMIQSSLISILEKIGKGEKFSFELPPLAEKKTVKGGPSIPSGLPRNKRWVKIRISGGLDPEKISKMEGISIIQQDEDSVTIAGDKDALQKAIDEISKVFR